MTLTKAQLAMLARVNRGASQYEGKRALGGAKTNNELLQREGYLLGATITQKGLDALSPARNKTMNGHTIDIVNMLKDAHRNVEIAALVARDYCDDEAFTQSLNALKEATFKALVAAEHKTRQ